MQSNQDSSAPSDASVGSVGGGGSRGNSGGRLRGSTRPLPLPVTVPLPVPLSNNQPLSELTVIRHNGADIELKAAELKTVRGLGKGRFGVVDQVRHPGTNCDFALKYLRRSSDPREYELQLREINVLRKAVECPFAVFFYGAMFHEGDILILMELMDASLRQLYLAAYSPAVNQPVTDPVLRYIAYSVLRALSYMRSIDVMHRDVKPSNMLVSRLGQVKMCDFGISGFLDNSIAKSNVGCELYLAPERILPPSPPLATDSNLSPAGDGKDALGVESTGSLLLRRKEGFTSAADVWSLGVSLVELATGAYPYEPIIGPFELNRRIVNDPAPTLPQSVASRFTPELPNFLARCLVKSQDERWRFDRLLAHSYLAGIDANPAREAGLRNETAGFVCDVLDKGGPDTATLPTSEV